MAQPPSEKDPQQEALFREVDEDLRHERLTLFWKQFGGIIIAAAVVVVAIVAGAQGWNAWETHQRAEAAAKFEAASDLLAQGDEAAALEALAAVSEDGGSGFAPLATLRRAAILAEDGQTEQAVTLYQVLANDGDADPVFRDAARVLAAMHGLSLLDPAELDGLLSPLRDGTGPWRPLAEELAALSALRQGDRETAISLLRGLFEDPQAPSNTRSRAGQMLAALGVEAPETGDAPEAEAIGGEGDGNG